MTPVPQVNAFLLSVEAGGFTEDYTRTAENTKPRWQGSSGAYVQEKERSAFSASGELNRTQETIIYMDDVIPVQLGDTLVYQYRGTTMSAKAAQTLNRNLPGAPSYNRVTLESVRATP